jgi:hypothetical protein
MENLGAGICMLMTTSAFLQSKDKGKQSVCKAAEKGGTE